MIFQCLAVYWMFLHVHSDHSFMQPTSSIQGEFVRYFFWLALKQKIGERIFSYLISWPRSVVRRDVKQIQVELMNNGPVEAAFTVFEDFPNYKSGNQVANVRVEVPDLDPCIFLARIQVFISGGWIRICCFHRIQWRLVGLVYGSYHGTGLQIVTWLHAAVSCRSLARDLPPYILYFRSLPARGW